MFFKDRSPRTLAIRRPQRLGVAALLALLISVLLLVSGMIRYNSVVAHSSSPIGTKIGFKRSDATAELKGIYTDDAESAMVARIGVDKQSAGRLPASGTDYNVYVSSPGLPGGVKKIDVLFGRLGTDGDMFLVLPKPTKQVYTVFIQNKKYLASGSDALAQANEMDQDSPADIAAGEKSITSSISDYKFDPTKEKDGGGEVDIDSDRSDIGSFRMTLDPAFHNEKYNPIILNTQLVDDNGDFNYKGMFEKLFKESAYAQLSKEHDDVANLEDRVKKSVDEYKQRLVANPDDQDASENLKEAESSVDQFESKKSELAEQLNSYQNLEYNDSTFSNMQTKAKVVDPDDK